MACVNVPIPTPPTLPPPFTIPIPSLPPIPDLTLCCKLPLPPIPPLPITFPPIVLNPAFILAINTAITTIEAYLDHIGLDCPKE